MGPAGQLETRRCVLRGDRDEQRGESRVKREGGVCVFGERDGDSKEKRGVDNKEKTPLTK